MFNYTKIFKKIIKIIYMNLLMLKLIKKIFYYVRNTVVFCYL